MDPGLTPYEKFFAAYQEQAPVLVNNTICLCGNNNKFVDDQHTGETICMNCGIVQTHHNMVMDQEETRYFQDDPSSFLKSRIGTTYNSLLSAECDMQTNITVANTTNNTENTRLRRNNVLLNTTSAFYRDTWANIKDMASPLAINDAMLQAAKFMLLELDQHIKTLKQRPRLNKEYVACTILGISLQREGYPRTFHELAYQCGLDKKQLTKCFTRIAKICPRLKQKRTNCSTSIHVAERLGHQLGLNFSTVQEIKNIATSATQVMEGRKPNTIAAFSVISALERKKLLQIADKQDYDVTLKNITELTGIAEKSATMLKESVLHILQSPQKINIGVVK